MDYKITWCEQTSMIMMRQDCPLPSYLYCRWRETPDAPPPDHFHSLYTIYSCWVILGKLTYILPDYNMSSRWREVQLKRSSVTHKNSRRRRSCRRDPQTRLDLFFRLFQSGLCWKELVMDQVLPSGRSWLFTQFTEHPKPRETFPSPFCSHLQLIEWCTDAKLE